ncbi:MAG TPA: paraquat-inducible protein A, partial [Segetibacter sp.]
AKKVQALYILLILVLTVLLTAATYFGYHVHTLSRQQEQIKEDYSTLNNITFGIFSIDEWRDKIAGAINPKVANLSITPQQKKQLYLKVETQLHALVDKTIKQFNKPQKSIAGKLRKFAFNRIVKGDQLHAQVPSFAQLIVAKATDQKTQKTLKNIVVSKVKKVEAQIYDSTESAIVAVTDSMFKKYNVAVTDEFNKTITSQVLSIQKKTYQYTYAMLACALAALILFLFARKRVQLQPVLFIVLVLFAFILLAVGLTAPIIEVDARINALELVLLEQRVAFENQVLFFQSKSISDIIRTLIYQPRADAVAAGIIILLFVIIFPVFKLVAAGVHILSSPKIAENKVVRYFTFSSRKWDMADVMVVGLIMTYIGLNSILQSQLSNLNLKTSALTSTPVNNSSLQPGFFIFVGYVVYEMILYGILKKLSRRLTDDG